MCRLPSFDEASRRPPKPVADDNQPMDTPPTTPQHSTEDFGKPEHGWRLRLYRIVFESDTRAGQLFDVVVIAAILLSIAVVVVDSMSQAAQYRGG
jgi:voltage-gated potassium channel